MKRVKWGKSLFAFLLSLAMLCTVIPETSYAAVSAEEGVEESIITNKDTKREDMAINKVPERKDKAVGEVLEKEHEETGETVKKEKKEEAIDSTGRAAWGNISIEDLENAAEIQDNIIQSVNIEEEGDYQVFKFIPTETKEYTFFSEGSYDTYGMLKSEDGAVDWSNDDREEDENFSITETLTAGNTYYCLAQMLDYEDTGSFLCMISSTISSFALSEENIKKFEITAYYCTTEYYRIENSVYDVPPGGYDYRITCMDDQIIEGYQPFYRSYIYGVPIGVRFKEETAEGVADTTGSNALIYSLAGVEAEEIPITYIDSPVKSMELLANPWTEVIQENAYDILDDFSGLRVRINYTDGTSKIAVAVYDYWYFEEDYDDEISPGCSWKNYDEYYNPAIGQNALIFTYLGAVLEVPVTVIDNGVESISIVQNPAQTIYEDYDIDLYGLKLQIAYTDGTSEVVTVTEYGDWFRIGKYNLTLRAYFEYDDDDNRTGKIYIWYGNTSTSYQVAIVDDIVQSISIIRNPAKLTYNIFDNGVDLYGLSLQVVYTDGTSETVTATEHDDEIRIGKYRLRLYGYFGYDDDDNKNGIIYIRYGNASVYYRVTLQTYASVLKNAEPILPGRTISISLNAAATYRLFRFVPLETKEFTISSTGTYDTYVHLLDASGNEIARDDDYDDDDLNFRLNYRLEAGKTYYYLVRMYRIGNVGTFNCTLSGGTTYTIAYNLNGGTNNASNPTAYYSETVALKNPTRPQYIFEGWYTDSAYKNKITQIAGTAKQNYVLYAKWQKVNVQGKAKLTSASNSKSKKIAVKYKKIKGVAGYEIAYATNKKFKKASTITTNKTKATIGKLKKGKTYYVRVCGYKLDSTGQKVRGKWSAPKKVTVKK